MKKEGEKGGRKGVRENEARGSGVREGENI